MVNVWHILRDAGLENGLCWIRESVLWQGCLNTWCINRRFIRAIARMNRRRESRRKVRHCCCQGDVCCTSSGDAPPSPLSLPLYWLLWQGARHPFLFRVFLFGGWRGSVWSPSHHPLSLRKRLTPPTSHPTKPWKWRYVKGLVWDWERFVERSDWDTMQAREGRAFPLETLGRLFHAAQCYRKRLRGNSREWRIEIS
jgi:hypothetical protein